MAQNIRAKIKLHEQNTPIRPIINWNNVSVCEVAKYPKKKALLNYLHSLKEICLAKLNKEI
jgi:hypothetical protein